MDLLEGTLMRGPHVESLEGNIGRRPRMELQVSTLGGHTLEGTPWREHTGRDHMEGTFWRGPPEWDHL